MTPQRAATAEGVADTDVEAVAVGEAVAVRAAEGVADAGTVVELTAATFDAEVARPGLTVVDFWAPWCGPCRAMEPHYARVAQLRPQYRFAKVNVDDHPQLANAFGISSIPTLLVLRDGAPLTMAIGGIVPEQFAAALDRLAA